MAYFTCPICNRGSNTGVHPGCARNIPVISVEELRTEINKVRTMRILRSLTSMQESINRKRL